MVTSFQKSQRVLSNPAMLRAYARWIVAGGSITGGPSLSTGAGTLVGFENFSEYWGVQQNLPSAGEQRLVKRLLRPGRIGVDIGANLGQFALLMSATGATVNSFEPVSETRARLVANLRANGRSDRVLCHALAVSSQCGEAFMQMTASAATNRLASGSDGLPVRTITLDEFCAQQSVDFIHLLKVDVEGAEPLVFHGAAGLLSRRAIGCVLLEMCPGNLDRLGFTVEDVLSAIQPHGYALYRLGEDGVATGESLAAADLAAMTLENVVAMPRADVGGG